MRDVLIAAVCATGLSACGWWLIGRLLRPIPAGGAFAVIPGHGDGGGLEQSVRAFIWLRSLGLLTCPVVIADGGLTPEGRELALRLSSRWPDVALWPAGHLEDLIS